MGRKWRMDLVKSTSNTPMRWNPRGRVAKGRLKAAKSRMPQAKDASFDSVRWEQLNIFSAHNLSVRNLICVLCLFCKTRCGYAVLKNETAFCHREAWRDPHILKSKMKWKKEQQTWQLVAILILFVELWSEFDRWRGALRCSLCADMRWNESDRLRGRLQSKLPLQSKLGIFWHYIHL